MPTRLTKTVTRLLRVNHRRKAYLQLYVRELGVTWENVRIMEHIRKHPGCMQADISKSIGITPAAVTQAIQKLEKQELIKRKTDEDNQRAKKLCLTEKGMEILSRGTELFDLTDGFMFEGFSEQELLEFEALLDRINENLAKCTVEKKKIMETRAE